ncbi:MAG: DUF559 domain-containing protein, partial [Synergistaceae bacterium]|nr:DUF559 domain-containing protein [Synergistaceae bacterium]
MNSLGLTVMRFRNHEIDYEFSGVCEKINSKAIKK